MRGSIIVCGLVMLAAAYSQPRANPDNATGGWIALFDGHSLRGWTPEQGAKWRVASGSIVGDAGDDGWLRSDGQFSDFLLRIKYKNAPRGNSGVFLRATKASNAADPSNPAGGYELQINNEDEKWATGSIENFIQRLLRVSPRADAWHSYEVEIQSDHIVATLDGIKVLDGRDSTYTRGYIGLQHHINNRIGFRDISIKPLGPASGCHLIKKIPVPGDYGWDYLTADSEGRRLCVSHEREVVVLDLDSDAIVGHIPDGKSVHGIAIARELGRGFITNGRPGSVTIFDLKTLARIGEVAVGEDPNVVLFDRRTQRVFTADRGSKRITAIDAKPGTIAGIVEGLGGRTEHAASDDAGHLFLNMQDLNMLLRIDTQSLKVTETWPVAPCRQPSSMDIDRAHERVFIGCRSGLMAVVDGTTGRVVTTQPIGQGVDATEFDAQRGLVYFSSGDGTMAVFRQETPDTYTLVERVQTQAGARTMAVDRRTGRAYLAVAQCGPRPAAAAGAAQPRPPMIPGSFSVIVFGE